MKAVGVFPKWNKSLHTCAIKLSFCARVWLLQVKKRLNYDIMSWATPISNRRQSYFLGSETAGSIQVLGRPHKPPTASDTIMEALSPRANCCQPEMQLASSAKCLGISWRRHEFGIARCLSLERLPSRAPGFQNKSTTNPIYRQITRKSSFHITHWMTGVYNHALLVGENSKKMRLPYNLTSSTIYDPHPHESSI